MSANKYTKSVVAERLVSVLNPATVNGAFYIQATFSEGQMKTVPSSQQIYAAVLGRRYGENNKNRTLGIRKLSACNYLLRYQKKNGAREEVVSIDIIPNRYFVRGTAPVAAKDAVQEGFELYFRDDTNGYEVKTTAEDGKEFRMAYLGMTQRDMLTLLDEIHAVDWGKKKSVTLTNHRVEKIEENLLRVRPLKGVQKALSEGSSAKGF